MLRFFKFQSKSSAVSTECRWSQARSTTSGVRTPFWILVFFTKMEIQVYLIYFSLFLTVHGLRLPSTKPIPDHDDLKRNDVTAAASDAGSVRPIKFDDSSLRPVLASNSPFFHHAKHQNSGFRNRPAAPVPVSFLLGRTASARSAQFLASDPDSCSATIRCDKTSTVQVSFSESWYLFFWNDLFHQVFETCFNSFVMVEIPIMKYLHW